ncbi:hypothetical protein PCH_Pc03g00270 [Penicillium rubens Wisconsin 54-1255]|uniref:Uncharacterized protein n=1 Tax=Penicillium rubens (strain ATCC 28089 / DSM 1075 / NRRL 1951 / Wisconsin 54-1255) TaxID=500485 RepID=B6GVS3_PENRW|nr:hypothetical protein PCH_Pc03g00270 [Penicillium rubens Wisconsin 54-1255]
MYHAPQEEVSLLRVTGRDLSLPADRVSQSPVEPPWLCLNEFIEGRRQTVHPAWKRPQDVLVRVARSFALTRFRPRVFHGAPERLAQPAAPPVVFPLAAQRHLMCPVSCLGDTTTTGEQVQLRSRLRVEDFLDPRQYCNHSTDHQHSSAGRSGATNAQSVSGSYKGPGGRGRCGRGPLPAPILAFRAKLRKNISGPQLYPVSVPWCPARTTRKHLRYQAWESAKCSRGQGVPGACSHVSDSD